MSPEAAHVGLVRGISSSGSWLHSGGCPQLNLMRLQLCWGGFFHSLTPGCSPGHWGPPRCPRCPWQGDSVMPRPPPRRPGRCHHLPRMGLLVAGHELSWLRWEETERRRHEQDVTPRWVLCPGGWAAPRLPWGDGSAPEPAVSAGDCVGGDVFS